jgi:CelD/BcsL family acetyltransferase involved in cellulose biosynthesis
MTIAARLTTAGRLASDCLRSDAPRTRVVVFDDFAAAESLWRQLEATSLLATPYQRFEWLANWFAHVGRRAGCVPLIVAGVGRDDAPMFILPLMRERRHGCHVARFCGGSHANLNMAIWRSDVAAPFAAPQIIAFLKDVAAERRIDLFALEGQPSVWCGVPNPFAALRAQPSPDDVYVGTLEAAPHARPRLTRRMRKKERGLMKLAGFHFGRAETPDDVDRLLAAFWPQKAARFAQDGIDNVFAKPGVMDFIRAACLDGLRQGRPAIELYALESVGEILAVIGGVGNRQRFSVMFNSITAGVHARRSPGILLTADILADCATRGIASFDLGAGHASYKAHFCSGRERRFDSFIPFSARGRALAVAYRATDVVLRSLKATPALMNVVHAARRGLFRMPRV